MKLKNLLVLALGLLSIANSLRASAQDEFTLPKELEKPPDTKKWMIKSDPFGRRAGATAEDYKAIESLRQQIARNYSESNFEAAEPLYKQYVALLEKVHVDESKLASALQHYADLLRKLHRDSEASACEVRAQALLLRAENKGIPYGLKEFKLGMSLDEFTRLPPPQAGPNEKIKAICSCDAGQTVETLPEDERKANVVQCGFWTASGDQISWTPHIMTVGGLQCTPDFKFIEDQGVYRLFEITVSFYTSNFDDMKKALLAKYGEPTANESQKVRSPEGRVLLDNRFAWDNGISKIKLRNFDGTSFTRSSLRYIHRQLFLLYAKRINEPKDQQLKNAASDL